MADPTQQLIGPLIRIVRFGEVNGRMMYSLRAPVLASNNQLPGLTQSIYKAFLADLQVEMDKACNESQKDSCSDMCLCVLCSTMCFVGLALCACGNGGEGVKVLDMVGGYSGRGQNEVSQLLKIKKRVKRFLNELNGNLDSFKWQFAESQAGYQVVAYPTFVKGTQKLQHVLEQRETSRANLLADESD
jgi:hypothetical protein